MIFRTFILTLVTFLWHTPLLANEFVVTNTHSYKVVSNGNGFEGVVHARNNQTKLLTRIIVGKNPIGLFIFDKKGYVPNATSGTITVIDLNSHTVTKTITLIEPNGHTLQDMIIEGSKAYIQFYESRHVQIIDLETDTVSACFDLPQTIHSITIYGSILYAVHSYTKSISRLWLGAGISKEVYHMTETPYRIIVMNPYYAYILTYNQRIVVLDLTTYRCYQTLELSGIPQDMIMLTDNSAYVTVFDSKKNTSSFQLLDFNGSKVKKELKLSTKPGKIRIVINTAYVIDDNNKHIFVIDLVHFQLYRVYRNPQNKDLYFSGTHLYSSGSIDDLKVVTSLDAFYMPTLFDNPYQGVIGDLCEEEETAFNNFANAMSTRGCPEAREHFDKALASGHPKAYAYAAYAILHELFGATWDLSYYCQFYEHCDKEYYQKLVKMFTEVLIQETL